MTALVGTLRYQRIIEQDGYYHFQHAGLAKNVYKVLEYVLPDLLYIEVPDGQYLLLSTLEKERHVLSFRAKGYRESVDFKKRNTYLSAARFLGYHLSGQLDSADRVFDVKEHTLEKTYRNL